MAAFRAALEETTRGRAPLEWARTQNNLGNALAALGARESGTGRLEAAVVAYDACLAAVARTWPESWVRPVRRSRDEVRGEIARRLRK